MSFTVEPVVIPPKLIIIENIRNATKKIRDTRSNHIILFRNISESEIVVDMNQRLRKVILQNCYNVDLQFLDSAVLSTKTVEVIDCHHCSISSDECDIRNLRLFDCTDMTFRFCDSNTLIENFRLLFYGQNHHSAVKRVIVRPGTNPNLCIALPFDLVKAYDVPPTPKGENLLGVQLHLGVDLKVIESLTEEESTLTKAKALADIEAADKANAVFEAPEYKGDKMGQIYKSELDEFEEPEDSLDTKAKQIANAIKAAKHVVFYTGAGISTSASLPDYRGPEGVWTLRADSPGNMEQKMKQKKDLGSAMPTFCHYAIAHLIKTGQIAFVTSSNLDGLHRRSGIPKNKISELHGNCYREICEVCDREYLRSFDTLPTRTDRWTHLTGRLCECGGGLKDTIIHFTETIRADQWDPAVDNARKSDVAVIMGTSMFVQPGASLPDKCLLNGGKMFVVNLQRTPVDQQSNLKVYAKTDHFMELLIKHLGIDTKDIDFTMDCAAVQREKEASLANGIFIQRLAFGAALAFVGFAAGVAAILNKKK